VVTTGIEVDGRGKAWFDHAGGSRMRVTRRTFIGTGLTVLAARRLAEAAQRGLKLRLGVPDWSLGQSAKPEAIPLAAKIGFAGVQISLGIADGDTLPLSDPARQRTYRDEARRAGVELTSCRVEMLHRNYLPSRDPLAPKWIAQAIPIAKALGFRVILVPFFGEGAIKSPGEMDYVGDVLRELGPQAEKAGVILGLEDTISARDNVRIMERSKSPAVLTYYDVGNSTQNGFNVVEEIRWLGRDRICEVHLKDNPHYLGEGKIDFVAVLDALRAIGYEGWAQLETTNPTKDVEADMGRNLAFIRKLV
jgi:L-ribulose-5-phosphate 3-epimerase